MLKFSVLLLMHKFVFILVGLTCASHAKRVKPSIDHSPGTSRAGSSSPFAVDPAAAFNVPSGQARFSVNKQAPIHAASRPVTLDKHQQLEGRWSAPMMAPEAVEEKVDSVSTEEDDDSDDASLSAGEKYRKEKQIVLTDTNGKGVDPELYEPFYRFDDTPYDPMIKDHFKDMGYQEPSPIQAQAWPIVLAQRDIIAIARTGSGKTCGFLLPALHQLMTGTGKFKDAEDKLPLKNLQSGEVSLKLRVNPRNIGRVIGKGGSNIQAIKDAYPACDIRRPQMGEDIFEVIGPREQVPLVGARIKDAASDSHSPKVLVLAPTRELATQIFEEAEKYTPATGIWSMAVYGGTQKREQVMELRKTKPEVVVCTPGRCKDLIQMGALDLSTCGYVVLDEADRMLDMGFGPDMIEILQYLPKERQTCMFSATWPQEVRRLASKFLDDQVQVQIGDGDVLNANKKIKQNFMFMNKRQKWDEVYTVLNKINTDKQKDPLNVPKTIIFTATKRDCDLVADQIFEAGYAVDSLHGDHEQERREAVMEGFREGSIRVLVATDVAARGLDVKDISAVINFDMPTGNQGGAEDYVHRIGRTGRGNNDGLAFSFFMDTDAKLAPALVGVLERAGQEIPTKLENMAKRNFAKFGKNGKKDVPLRDNTKRTKVTKNGSPTTPKFRKEKAPKAAPGASPSSDILGSDIFSGSADVFGARARKFGNEPSDLLGDDLWNDVDNDYDNEAAPPPSRKASASDGIIEFGAPMSDRMGASDDDDERRRLEKRRLRREAREFGAPQADLGPDFLKKFREDSRFDEDELDVGIDLGLKDSRFSNSAQEGLGRTKFRREKPGRKGARDEGFEDAGSFGAAQRGSERDFGAFPSRFSKPPAGRELRPAGRNPSPFGGSFKSGNPPPFGGGFKSVTPAPKRQYDGKFGGGSFGASSLPERYGGGGPSSAGSGGAWKKNGGKSAKDQRLPPPDLDALFEKLLKESRERGDP
mmetsp:Transcript_111823/g.215353  ORF Transcript_111823/g.215353 Transcript_111823/m.215353 type:complete len:981 (+) Transcript_111823:18-2960(+)